MKTHSTHQNVLWAIKNKQPNWYTRVAKEVADEMGLEYNPVTKGHNDERDALRHTYIMALGGYRYPDSIVKAFGDLNEDKNILNPAGEEWMDLHNNAMGFEIAARVQSARGSEEDLKTAVIDAMQKGKLVLTPFDPRRTLIVHGDLERAIAESEKLLQDELIRELDAIASSNMSAADKQRARFRLDHKYREYENQRQKAVEQVKTSSFQRSSADVEVRGHTRRGIEINSHFRTQPDGDPSNNRSR